MDRAHWTPEDLAQGYAREEGGYRCAACGRLFEEGEVYPSGGRFYTASRAVALHLEREHPDYLQTGLIDSDSKYNTLTRNQRRLYTLFAQGLPDKEVAARLGVSISTVRHQKFVFREKAKQARHYLAIYEGVFGCCSTDGAIVALCERAEEVDGQ